MADGSRHGRYRSLLDRLERDSDPETTRAHAFIKSEQLKCGSEGNIHGEPSSAASSHQPRVAVCIAGLVRTLVSPLVWRSAAKFLALTSTEFELSTVAVLELTAVSPSRNRWAEQPTSACALQAALKGLNVQRLKLVNSTRDVHISEHCGGHSQSALFQFDKWARCVPLVRSLEQAEQQRTHDFLLVARSDTIYFRPLDVWHAAKTLQRGAVLSCADRRQLWARRDWASLEALPSTLCPRYCLFNKKVAAHDGSTTTGSSKQTYANEYCVRAAHLAAHGLVTLETSPWDAVSCRPPVFGRSWAGTAAANATKFVPGARSVDWCDLQTARWPTEAGGSCTGGFCVPPVPLQPEADTGCARSFEAWSSPTR